MSTKKNVETLIATVGDTIARFDLIHKENRVVVAFSGGKDSALIAWTLSELGYDVSMVSIDMGYEPGWGERIKAAGKRIGFDVHVLDVNTVRIGDLSRESDLTSNLRALFTQNPSTSFTPCTHCYNSKILLLAQFFEDFAQDKVVFGHHQTDAIASLIKSAMYYIDRWDLQHESFDRQNYESLAKELLGELLDCYSDRTSSSRLLQRMQVLTTSGVAATDEPPVENVKLSGFLLPIIRPLFDVSEFEVIQCCTELGLTVEPSGCGHTNTAMTQTPREIVHYRILRYVDSSDWAQFISTKFAPMIDMGIDEHGVRTYDPRRTRPSLLGDAYKSSNSGIDKL